MFWPRVIVMREIYAGKAAADDVTRNLELSCDGLALPRRCTVSVAARSRNIQWVSSVDR